MVEIVRNPFSSSRQACATPAGVDYVEEFIGVTLENGARIRQCVGCHNHSEAVQSYLDGVLIENILKRCALTGEDPNRSAGRYVDLTGLPREFADLQQMMAQARSLYHTLPTDVVQAYPTFESFSEAILAAPDSDLFKGVYTALGVIKPVSDVQASAQEVVSNG